MTLKSLCGCHAVPHNVSNRTLLGHILLLGMIAICMVNSSQVTSRVACHAVVVRKEPQLWRAEDYSAPLLVP